MQVWPASKHTYPPQATHLVRQACAALWPHGKANCTSRWHLGRQAGRQQQAPDAAWNNIRRLSNFPLSHPCLSLYTATVSIRLYTPFLPLSTTYSLSHFSFLYAHSLQGGVVWRGRQPGWLDAPCHIIKTAVRVQCSNKGVIAMGAHYMALWFQMTGVSLSASSNRGPCQLCLR